MYFKKKTAKRSTHFDNFVGPRVRSNKIMDGQALTERTSADK
jgi:hypothetical protein